MADDLLISTEIDKIITILKKKKYISLNDLSRDSSISVSSLEKWMPILEEEGMVKIVYHLTRIYVEWVGEPEYYNVQPDLVKVPNKIEPVNLKIKEDVSKSHDDVMKELKKHDVHDDSNPYGSMEISNDYNRDHGNLDISHIPKKMSKKEVDKWKDSEVDIHVGNADSDDSDDVQINNVTLKPLNYNKKVDLKIKPLELPVKVSPYEMHEYDDVEVISHAHATGRVKTMSGKLKMVDTSTKEKLNPYANKLRELMAQVATTRSELDRLKEEKIKLYREVYEPMEKRFGSEYQTISEKISNKEEKILSLQQKTLELPSLIDEIDRQQLRLRGVETDARKIFDESSVVISESITELRDLEDQLSGSIEDTRVGINENISHLDEMDLLMNRIDSLESEVVDNLNDAYDKLKEQKIKIDDLNLSLNKLVSVKDNVQGKMVQSESIVSEQKLRLSDMEKQMSNVTEICDWVEEHQKDYNLKMDEFSEYIHSNELEYNTLRESVEADYVKRYLKDLQSLSNSYDFELSQALSDEKSVDEKITSSKNKLNELIKQSRELVEAFENGAPTDYQHDVNVLSNRNQVMVQSMERVAKDRMGITNVIRQVKVNQPKSSKTSSLVPVNKTKKSLVKTSNKKQIVSKKKKGTKSKKSKKNK